MKTLFGAIVVLALVLVTGGLYYKMRSADKKKSDWQRVASVPTKMWNGIKAVGSYFKSLFATKPEAAPARQAA